MPPIPALFVLPITPAGRITCTQPSPRVYLLTFESPPDNRMTPAFCYTFLLALDILDHRFPKGVVVTTSGIQKFYSNGLDYESAIKTKGFFGEVLYPLWRRLLTYAAPLSLWIHTLFKFGQLYADHVWWYSYPMPTLAVLPGHAFAAGFMTAMMHDYRIMNPHRGYLCLNELDFGAPLQPPMASIFRQKVPSPNTFRTIVLESKRIGALEGVKEGLLDSVGGVEEAITLIQEMRLLDRAKSGVYGRLKQEMWGETVLLLEDYKDSEQKESRSRERQDTRREQEILRVEQWERKTKTAKSKL